MPVFSFTRNYEDGQVFTQAQLDALVDSIETALNTTKIDSTNIQSGGVAEASLASACVSAGKIAADAVVTAKIQDAAVVTAKIADAAVTSAKLASGVGLPSGLVSPWAGSSTAPTGWMLCDGSAVSRTTYAALFTAIGTAHGTGDGSTTFNLPDYRGRFLRMVDGSAGVDPDKASRAAMATGGNSGNNIGSVQSGATARPSTSFTADSQGAHTHTSALSATAVQPGTGGGSDGVYVTNSGSTTTSSNGAHTHTITGGGDSETRPVNAYVYYIIKT